MPRNPIPTKKNLLVPALKKLNLPAIEHVREIPLNLHFWHNYPKYRSDCLALIDKVALGLRNYQPELLDGGDGGAYLLRDDIGNKLAIFKPFDEDPFSPRNPKAPQRSLTFSDPSSVAARTRSIHRPGESAQKEVAAYLLDHKNEAGVPLTTLVQISSHQWGPPGKLGSLQKFVPHLHDSWELSPSLYNKTDLHRIALLDMRLLNCDRHGGNILVCREPQGFKLVPIDHGFCLPDSVEDCGSDMWFEWMSWPQAKQPVVDPVLLKSIKEINIEEDARILRGIGIREEAISTMMWCTVLVQQALISGRTPLEIAEMILHRTKGGCGISVNDEELIMYRVEAILEQKGYGKYKCSIEDDEVANNDDGDSPKKCHRRQKSAPNLCCGFPGASPN